jgi:hypothetical protein
MRVTDTKWSTTMKTSLATSLALGIATLLPIGCGAAPDDASLETLELGEDSAPICTALVLPNAIFNLAAAVAGLSTSANAAYGSKVCVGRYLVDLENTTNKSFSSYADWGDTAATAANCGYHHVIARMDGFLPPSATDPQGHWINLTPDRSAAGVFGNGVCRNRVDLTTLQGLTPYSKVRIAARAYTLSGPELSIQTAAKVSVGFKVSTLPGY